LGAATNERRLAAILAADVVGYSRMIGADEVGTLARLRTLRREVVEPLVAESGGRVFKTTGDGLLAEFPSTVQALRCAMGVQERLRGDELQLRVGVHQGDVVVEGDDLLGDGVNIAARLEGLAEPGGICISGRVREDAAGKIALDVEDLGEPELKNIAQRHRVFRVRLGEPERPALPLPDKPSIAVLPFQNMSGDPEQEYFADGVVEDITTALSRIGGLVVIARNSSFAYKGKSPDVRQVGRELGVRYVLEGSVRKSGGRVRITAQLIEAANGGHIWADRFEGPLDDIFDLQDRVTEHVVGALEPSLMKAEIGRATAKPTDRLDAYDLYLQALQQMNLRTAEANRKAERLLQHAIDMDGRFGLAKALAAQAVLHSVMYQWRPEDSEAAARAVALARSALADSPDDPTVLSLAGIVLSYLARDLDAARALLDRALLLNGNSATVLRISGWIHNWRWEFNPARDEFARAIRLSPLDPLLNLIRGGLALALACGEPPELQRALDLVDQCLAVSPNDFLNMLQRVQILVMLGRIGEAKETAQRMLTVAPDTSISGFRRRWLYRGKERTERELDMFRLAGIPE
jgi:adenylate cyclase